MEEIYKRGAVAARALDITAYIEACDELRAAMANKVKPRKPKKKAIKVKSPVTQKQIDEAVDKLDTDGVLDIEDIIDEVVDWSILNYPGWFVCSGCGQLKYEEADVFATLSLCNSCVSRVEDIV
jgi:hypothetical protein